MKGLLLTLGVSLLLAACKPPHIDDYDPAEQPAAMGGPEETETRLIDVHGETITLGDYQRRLQGLSDLGRKRVAGVAPQRAFLEDILAVHLLAEAARQAGLSQDPEVGWAERRALAGVVSRRLLQGQGGDSELGQRELRVLYDINRYRFQRPEQVWIALLLVEDEARAVHLARAYNERFVRDLGPSLRLFDELTAAEAAHTPQLGDLGFVDRSVLAELAHSELVEAVLRLRQPGELAGPIAVVGGQALVQLRQRRTPIREALAHAAVSLTEENRAQRRDFLRQRLLWEWREGSAIEVDDEALERLRAARARTAPRPERADWEEVPGFVLDERLTPRRDLTMLGSLLGSPPEVGEAPPTD